MTLLTKLVAPIARALADELEQRAHSRQEQIEAERAARNARLSGLLREKIAEKVAEHEPDADAAAWGAPPPPAFPDTAQPLTAEQRAGLEKLRDKYAPDRQRNHRAQ
jgi:hypothetical protein